MTCAARAMAAALQASIENQESIVGEDVNAEDAPAASTLTSSIDIGNDDGIQVQHEDAPARERRQPMVSTPQVALVESDDEYGEDEDATWQGRSPMYPALTWARRERREHMTDMCIGLGALVPGALVPGALVPRACKATWWARMRGALVTGCGGSAGDGSVHSRV